MSEQTKITEEELHAFIDGEIPPARRAEIEAEACRNPVLAEKIAAFASDMERLRRTYGAIGAGPIPDRWMAIVESAARKPRPALSPQTFAAIAATILIVLGVALVYRAISPQNDTIIADALAARSASLENRGITTGPPVSQASRATAALSSALHMRLKAPDLSRMGYRLSAYRLYKGTPRGNAVELVYHNADGRLFTLYLRHSSGSVRFDQFKLGQLRVCIWQDDVLGAVMAGPISAAEMQRLASLAYTGLTS